MKATKLISGGLMIISLLAFSGQVSAQNKSREEKEKELRMAEEIDAQKKAISEQKRKEEEMKRADKELREEVDKAMKEAREKLEEAGIYNEMSKDFRNWNDNPAFKWQQFEDLWDEAHEYLTFVKDHETYRTYVTDLSNIDSLLHIFRAVKKHPWPANGFGRRKVEVFRPVL